MSLLGSRTCRRLTSEEAAASKDALSNVQPDTDAIRSIMQAFITGSAELKPQQGKCCPSVPQIPYLSRLHELICSI